MLGRWLFVRIRSAERALLEGRIDEAFGVACQPDVRQHARGQKLSDQLVRPLLARVRLHLQGARHAEAMADLDKLKALERGGPEVETLRQRVLAEFEARRQRVADGRADLARAAEKLDAGRLETGRLAIELVQDARQRQELQEQLELRVERSAQLLAQARAALERADVPAALRLWEEATRRHGRTRESDEVAAELVVVYRRVLGDWFASGQIGRLLAARTGLAALREFDPALDEFEQRAALCQRAAGQLGAREYGPLRDTLLRLRSAQQGVAWLEQMLKALTQVREGEELLLSSPLGLKASAAGVPVEAAVHRGVTPTVNAPVPPLGPPCADELAAAELGRVPLLMLVDGAGSSLILPLDCVRIGRAGGRGGVDVALPGDLQSHHADVLRDGSDYFLVAHGPVQVNRRTVKRTLLHDGDRIHLSAKVRLTFHKPSVRSDSAVLRLSQRCRLAQDVGSVVLFRDTCLIGPQPSCHVRTQDGQTQVVLFDRAGRLFGREATALGGKLGDPRPLVAGRTLDFSDVRVTIKAYDALSRGG